MIAKRTLILALLSCILAACGGGGGGGGGGGTSGGGGGGTGGDPPAPPPGGGPPNNPPPEQPGPTSEERSYARSARLILIQDSAQLTINWVDLFDNELGYDVERRIGEGNWELVEALPAMQGGLGYWSRTADVSARYRVSVDLGEYSLPLQSTGGEADIYIDVGPSTSPITIAIDRPEPVSGDVQVSMLNADSAQSVSYFLDQVQFALATGGSFAATLPAQQLLDGQHSLVAIVEKSQGLLVFRRRQLQVDNPAPAVLLNYVALRSPGEPLVLRAKATSDAGIASVEFFVNGNSVQVVSTPSSGGSPFPGEYVYSMDPTTLPAGENVFRAVATDNNTATASMERAVTLDLVPSLNVTGLFDGMITSGNSVNIQGDFSDETAGATLTISAGDRLVLRTQTSPFAASFSDLAPGEHSVTVRVQDQQGKVNSRFYRVIVPSTPLGYELLATDADSLLAADQGSLLYRKRSGEVVLMNAAGVASALPPASAGFANYQLTEGRIVAWGQDRRVYVLDAAGQATDLSQQNSFASSIAPNVRGPWVSWVPAGVNTMLKAYNLHTNTLTDIPIGGSSPAAQRHDFITTPGNEQLLFGATLGGSAGIYSFNLATNVTQRLVSGIGSPRSDGTRLLWTSGVELRIAPLSNPTASTLLDTGVVRSTLDDGLACWLNTTFAVHCHDGTVLTQLRLQATSNSEYTSKNGRVIFSKNDKMVAWSPSSGERQWLDTPTTAIHASGVAYFMTGSSGTLYRVTLP